MGVSLIQLIKATIIGILQIMIIHPGRRQEGVLAALLEASMKHHQHLSHRVLNHLANKEVFYLNFLILSQKAKDST
jgi:hypothetical protein